MADRLRAPRLQVLLDGAVLPGVVSADVDANNHLAADRFRVRLAARGAPMAALHGPGARVEVQVSLEGGWTSLVTGAVDSLGLDAVQGVLEMEGRDLSAMLIEARVDETFANRTASEIAEVLASRHGLQASVQRTTTAVGRYYQAEHDRLTLGQFAKATSEWDLLAYLAGQEGFDLFMEGNTLRFGPADTGRAAEIRREDCISLHLEHAVNLGRQIEVTVKSWGTRTGSAVTQMARGGAGGTTWKHGLTRPNLTPDEAQRLADRVLADLVRHEWTATAQMPGELGLTARSRVAISGTGTPWDRTYGVSALSRHLDVRQGFTQRLSLQGVA